MDTLYSNEVALHWRKSSYSGSTGECVEVASSNATANLLVRDSKDPSGEVLRFTHEAWQAFLAGVQAGELQARA